MGSPSARTAAAESPPPTTLKAPDARIDSATLRVPSANGASSNTPIGPFQNTVCAPVSTCPNAAADAGPMSSPFHPSGIASADTMRLGAEAETSSATTTSTGSTTFPEPRNSRQAPICACSSSESPTRWPCAARNVKHIPPPTSSVSTFGSSASITASLSETFDPPSTTT